jgi:hypothetical protein
MRLAARCLAALWLAASLAPPAAAASPEPEQLAEAFLAALDKKELEAGFAALLEHADFDEARPQETALLKTQIRTLYDLYGKTYGFEQVTEKKYGQSLRRLVYVFRFGNVPVVWNFHFYRVGESWRLLNLHANDQLQGLE